ncbi:PilW family protein [Xanthomonas vasicola]|nr:PilW family protein [Xanthomonas vasicola]MDO6935282.1 PilW family protein [Xanthomonas vasicola]MDO6939124.1 PilW family protein [Xanthomonas vasicola]MDO6951458.1 PilW family protein [Xanthomonas vasicola]MDO6985945.1 PilW family protein [Xanthomonas vasicola]
MNLMKRARPSRSRMRGVTLIELMIALVLGLLVVGAAIGIFLANRRTYSATEGLGRVQENVRTAFELMARDVREASGNPCVNTVPVANVLKTKASNWYTNIDTWNAGITGVEGAFPSGSPANGTATGARVAGTDALQILGSGYEVATISSDNTSAATFTLNMTAAAAGINVGDVAVACNARQSAIFQVSAVSGSTITHAVSGVSPGNCSTGLAMPVCGGSQFAFVAPGSVVANLHAARWFIGNNASGTRSLYQSQMVYSGGALAQRNDEVLEGVNDMQLQYLVKDAASYVDATAVSDWSSVVAVSVRLEMLDTTRVGPAGEPIRRTLSHVIALRNRNA